MENRLATEGKDRNPKLLEEVRRVPRVRHYCFRAAETHARGSGGS